jgi:hypothetical protein
MKLIEGKLGPPPRLGGGGGVQRRAALHLPGQDEVTLLLKPTLNARVKKALHCERVVPCVAHEATVTVCPRVTAQSGMLHHNYCQVDR